MKGAIIGDIVGSVYEFHNIKTKAFPLWSPAGKFTDDSVMTVAVAMALMEGTDDRDRLLDAVTDYMRSSALISYGPEAVAAYLSAIEGEIQAVRMILTGRLAGVKPEAIRERLRDLYA